MRIGTRGSALALAQAGWVAGALGEGTEIVTVVTSGDRAAGGQYGAVPSLDKSRWVSELERALLGGEIDVAVHSAKDVPAELADGLELVAIPAREDARDAICGADSLAGLAPGAAVGTSSLRRAAQLLAIRDDLDVVPIRGNVDTRLRKLAEGQVDALVLAMAGLSRLGREREAGGVLDALVPAAGQGALALEARIGDTRTTARVAGLCDRSAYACVAAERELVRALGASCDTAVGAHAALLDGEQLQLRGWVGVPDGSAWLLDTRIAEGRARDGLGRAVAERMLAAGAGELLRAAQGQG